MNNEAILYNGEIIDMGNKNNKIMQTKRRVFDMNVLLNRIYKTDDQYKSYRKLLEQGLSFSGKNIQGKVGGILFI